MIWKRAMEDIFGGVEIIMRGNGRMIVWKEKGRKYIWMETIMKVKFPENNMKGKESIIIKKEVICKDNGKIIS